MARHGVFPGSFDPLTVAHLAVADAARARCGLLGVDLVVSEVPLAKEDRHQTPVAERLAAIEAQRHHRSWLRARSTTAQLLADIATGYDVLIIGADKWHQLHDERFYGSARAMADALARLPQLAVAGRGDLEAPSADGVIHLDVGEDHRHVSSTAVREGRDDWRA